ncbi:MAG: acylase [Bacteroidetes bacterium]|nr:acylase [Bacteroidota bacterium]
MLRVCLLLLLPLFLRAQSIQPNAIKIARDAYGVPHIFAKTDPEVAYGLAWAHAEDDFATIQLTMLAGQHSLAKLKGKDGATVDYIVQLLRCREVVDAQFSTLSPDFVRLVEGYVQGMNAYARAHPREVLVRGSFPTNVKDYLAAIVFSTAIISGVDKVLSSIVSGKVAMLKEFESGGSNAMAVHASKTTDGHSYLAINSHQPLEGPVAWYEAHLCSEQGWNMLGGLFPGGPVVFLGTNENLGWAHTVNHQDKIDVYQLEINPDDPYQYRFDGKWERLEAKKVKLKVKVGPIRVPVKKEVLWSKYGATLRNDQGTFSIRFGANQDIRAAEQWYRMNKARNFAEFYKAMEMTAIPGFNTIYADRNDTIFYVSNGKIPLRNPAYDWQGTLPGNTSRTLWTQYHPVQDLPQYLNPESGYLFNTNNTPYNATGTGDNLAADDFDQTMGYETIDNNRSLRMQELFGQYDQLSYENFKRIKYDNQLPDKLAYPTDLEVLFKVDTVAHPDIKPLVKTLQEWDRKSDADSQGAAVFLMCYRYFYEKFAKTGYDQSPGEAECVQALRTVKSELFTTFGRFDVTLGEFQKLVRGRKVLPIWGLPDVITAIYPTEYKNGKVKAAVGESYIELVRYPKDGLPIIESVINYGASNRPDSPHYADQMELFVEQKTKKMTLDKEQVLREAKRIYSPQ